MVYTLLIAFFKKFKIFIEDSVIYFLNKIVLLPKPIVIIVFGMLFFYILFIYLFCYIVVSIIFGENAWLKFSDFLNENIYVIIFFMKMLKYIFPIFIFIYTFFR
jgi:hypothetical protein